jgi:hypothetical protein
MANALDFSTNAKSRLKDEMSRFEGTQPEEGDFNDFYNVCRINHK